MGAGCACTPVPLGGLPCHLELESSRSSALVTAAETALLTPSPSNNLDRVYLSFRTTFQMEPYLSELHRGPQRTTLVRFRLGQHWLYTRIGRFGPRRVPYDSRWCQYWHHLFSEFQGSHEDRQIQLGFTKKRSTVVYLRRLSMNMPSYLLIPALRVGPAALFVKLPGSILLIYLGKL